jgi:lysophospholipase L1-like esterase
MRIAALLLAAFTLNAADFYLHPNDTVVFYGDSITDQRLYTTYTETFVVTRFPKLPVRFVHSGWGGDRVTGGGGGPIDDRLKRDVFAYKPTVVTVMLGMNDGRYRAYDDAIFQEFASGYDHLVQSIKSALPGVRMTLIQPSPYDDVTRSPMFAGGYNEVLLRYGKYLRDLSTREHVDFADLNTRLVDALKRANAADPTNAQKVVPDRIHPARGGHLLMAASLLESWGAPATVTKVAIDAKSGEVRESANTSVSGIDTKDGLRWTQKDEALPMPLPMNDPVLALAVKSSDFVARFNQQTLRVSGLTGSNYALRINGKQVGTFTPDQLDRGINLAELDTPMTQQAAQVHALTLKRADIHNARWRQLQVPLQTDSMPRIGAVLDQLDALDADFAAIQRATAQPAACSYELIPAQ